MTTSFGPAPRAAVVALPGVLTDRRGSPARRSGSAPWPHRDGCKCVARHCQIGRRWVNVRVSVVPSRSFRFYLRSRMSPFFATFHRRVSMP